MINTFRVQFTAVVLSALCIPAVLCWTGDSNAISPQQDLAPPQAFLELPQQPKALTPAPGAETAIDPTTDPLFIEIQKMIVDGNKSKSDPSNQNNAKTTSIADDPANSFSTARWNAIESMLKAARLLDQDANQLFERNATERAVKAKSAANQLRKQCVELLRL